MSGWDSGRGSVRLGLLDTLPPSSCRLRVLTSRGGEVLVESALRAKFAVAEAALPIARADVALKSWPAVAKRGPVLVAGTPARWKLLQAGAARKVVGQRPTPWWASE